jgi:methylglutaconyl-CoA hydratase
MVREMDTSTPEVLYTLEGTIALLTLNRPAKRNALNPGLLEGLKQRLREAEGDQSVRVIVLTGAGPDFCAGADLASLQEISRSSATENLADAKSLMELFTLIRKLRVPVVAAVRGNALAGGSGLATACDIVLAARSARFGYPEVKIGFVPAMVMAILRRNVSEKRAFEMLATGLTISAEEAERIGLVNRVFDDSSFDRDVEAYARRFERVSPTAVTLSKRLLYQIDGMTFEAAIQSGAEVNVIARMTEDCREGIERFLKSG